MRHGLKLAVLFCLLPIILPFLALGFLWGVASNAFAAGMLAYGEFLS